MKKRIETLLTLYYEGKSSLAEEKELRELLLKVSGFEEEKQFILGLDVFKTLEPSERAIPRARGEISLWQKVAAVLAVFLGLSWLFIDQQMKREEVMAYETVMEAFELIQENMIKGTKPLAAIQDMQYLNKPHEIFNINNKEEQ